MNFFKLTHPEYQTDEEADAENPVVAAPRHGIPALICPRCGIWASSDRLRGSRLPDDMSEFVVRKALPITEWRAQRARWSTLLDVPVASISPGAEVGPPRGEARSEVISDVVHPMPGQVWVSDSVARAVERERLSGLELVAVDLHNSRCHLWELFVRGRAWREGSSDAFLRACQVCDRSGFPSPLILSVDASTWDGSDFFLVDNNPNIILVSPRVREVFNGLAVGNIEFVAVP